MECVLNICPKCKYWIVAIAYLLWRAKVQENRNRARARVKSRTWCDHVYVIERIEISCDYVMSTDCSNTWIEKSIQIDMCVGMGIYMAVLHCLGIDNSVYFSPLHFIQLQIVSKFIMYRKLFDIVSLAKSVDMGCFCFIMCTSIRAHRFPLQDNLYCCDFSPFSYIPISLHHYN